MTWSKELTFAPTEAIPQEETVTVSWDGERYFCTCDSERYRNTMDCTHIDAVVDDGLHEPPMTLYRAVMIIEDPNVDVNCETDFIDAWQFLIDNGHAWKLQGWYGRTAIQLIQEGRCKPPEGYYVET
jgi:hypothetical protein